MNRKVNGQASLPACRQARRNGQASAAKGYRLKLGTHKLIEKLQRKIKGTKDDVLSRACSMYYGSLIDSEKKIK